jgi:hypothetical protein
MILAGPRLNSGVAILSMSFGLPVVYPKEGCLPSVLSRGHNVGYDIHDTVDMCKAMKKVLQFDSSAVKAKNMKVAEEWTWDYMASEILANID